MLPGLAAPVAATEPVGPAIVTGLPGELVSQRGPRRAALPGGPQPGFWFPGDEQERSAHRAALPGGPRPGFWLPGDEQVRSAHRAALPGRPQPGRWLPGDEP